MLPPFPLPAQNMVQYLTHPGIVEGNRLGKTLVTSPIMDGMSMCILNILLFQAAVHQCHL